MRRFGTYIVFRHDIWSHHLTICVFLVSLADCNSAWSEVSQMVWHLFSNSQRVMWPWRHSNFFLSKHKNLQKDNLILTNFYHNDLRSIMTSLGDIVLQSLVELGNKNRKIISNRLKLSLRFSHFFHQNGFLRLLKSIFHWEIFFNSRIIKNR